MTRATERLHYMDNLRALIMIAGIFYHASHAYNTQTNPLWISSDIVQSQVLVILFEFMHIWRMPIFFVVAGFFTAFLIQRLGIRNMLKNRLFRVGIPLLVFWPLLMIAFYLCILWAVDNVENKSTMLQLLTNRQKMPDGPLHLLSLAHLWFLYYLMIFYAITCAFKKLPLSNIKTFIINIHPVLAIILLPVLLVPGLSLTVIHIRPTHSFIPEIWAILFFGMFFAYGYILFSSPRLLDYFQRTWPILLISALIIFIPIGYLYPPVSSNPLSIPFQPKWSVRLPLILCIAYISTFMCIVCLVVAKKVLNNHNQFMRYMSDASYWIYIVHLPILLMIQFWLLDQNATAVNKFLFSSLTTLVICALSYILFVRWSPIGWLLNGQRKPVFLT